MSVFGVPPSIIHSPVAVLPSIFSTSMWIQACGLTHSVLLTLPSSLSGLLASNSGEDVWCGRSGAGGGGRAGAGRRGGERQADAGDANQKQFAHRCDSFLR